MGGSRQQGIDHVGSVAGEGVVGGQGGLSVVDHRLRTEGRVDLGDDLGAAGAGGGLPGLLDGAEEVAGPGGRGGGEEAVAPAGYAVERGGAEAIEQDLGAAGVGGRAADGTGVGGVRRSGPDAAHDGHVLVEPTATGAGVGVGGLEVVAASGVADAEAVTAATADRVTRGSGLSYARQSSRPRVVKGPASARRAQSSRAVGSLMGRPRPMFMVPPGRRPSGPANAARGAPSCGVIPWEHAPEGAKSNCGSRNSRPRR